MKVDFLLIFSATFLVTIECVQLQRFIPQGITLLLLCLKTAAETCPSCSSSNYCYCTAQNQYVTCSSCVAPTVLALGSQGQITTIAGYYDGYTGYDTSSTNVVATSAKFSNIQSIAVDSSGNIYISDQWNQIIRMVVQSSGTIYTIVGTKGSQGLSGDKGHATSAQLNNPKGITLDSSDNLIISDYYNYAIRKVTFGNSGPLNPSGKVMDATITTIVGTLGTSGSTLGAATSASLKGPSSLCYGPDGTLYFVDNYAVKVLSSTNIVSVFAGIQGSTGNYGDNGAATSAKFSTTISSLWVDASSNVFISDYGSNVIRKVDSISKIIRLYAGTYSLTSANAGSPGQSATSVNLRSPVGIDGDSLGNLYVAEAGYNYNNYGSYYYRRVRYVGSNGIVNILAGSSSESTSGHDGDMGPASSATLEGPTALCVDASNNVYFADTGSVIASPKYGVIRKVYNSLGTSSPVVASTPAPTATPVQRPTSQPSRQPTRQPTRRPSHRPTRQPTTQPTNPTGQPTQQPSSRPSRQPTMQPSRQPSRKPSRLPTNQPTRQPTRRPTSQPSRQPTRQPSSQPTRQPTQQPSARPSRIPTSRPSRRPTERPTRSPKSHPTSQPTRQPSRQPTSRPSRQPSEQPTSRPTSSKPSYAPTYVPSHRPTEWWETNEPSSQPTTVPTRPSYAPTLVPTEFPSTQPTSVPSGCPSSQPSEQPTEQPSEKPSSRPSCQPSEHPTQQPTVKPSRQPSSQPSEEPSMQPSSQPSRCPTSPPTCRPSTHPSTEPTTLPTSQPSVKPTKRPHFKARAPTHVPSKKPTAGPSELPSSKPSDVPSSLPTTMPSSLPSEQPSGVPTTQPSANPSGEPTMQPSSQPSRQPSAQPTTEPSRQPSGQPTRRPSRQPSAQPSSHPSSQPSRQPSSQPSRHPSRQPTIQPSRQPSQQPTGQPSKQPVSPPTVRPSTQPSRQPTSIPTKPTGQPSHQPTRLPSEQPTQQPSSHPTKPSGQPTYMPTKPSGQPSSQPTNPTGQPSRQPSSRPTAKPTQNIHPGIPFVKSMLVSPQAHNVSIWLLLDIPPTTKDAAGSVYCAAFPAGTVPSSTDLVVSEGAVTEYTSAVDPAGVTVHVTGLIPLASYTTYCYVEAAGGWGGTYQTVLSTARTFDTACCKVLTFTNAPPSVFGDVTKYKSTTSSSKYVFTYAVEAAPRYTKTIRVTPRFFYANGTAILAGVAATPSSVVFTGDMVSYQLTSSGLFYLSAARTITGSIVVQLVITGPGSIEYSSGLSTSVTIISSNDPLPAPNMLSTVFGNNGASFTINFDTTTDQAGITTSYWPCSQLFTFVGSNYTTCSWSDSATVTGKFGTLDLAKSYLSPGGSVTVRGGVLRATCAVPGVPRCRINLVTNTTTVTVDPPTVALTPSIVMIMPAQIGGCTNLKIDLSATTGNGGRPWKSVVWKVTTSTGGGADVQQYLKNNYQNSSGTVIVPRAQLAPISYSISVTLQNFLGGSATMLKSVAVNPDRDQPVPSIFGPSSIMITAASVLQLVGSAQLSPCASSNIISYSWAISDSADVVLTNLKSTSVDNRKFSLPAYSLKALSSYTVTLTAKSMSSAGSVLSSNFYTVSVFVAHGNVVTAVKGGYAKSIPADKPLVLDASISYDEDSAPGAVGVKPLNFTWSCSVSSLVNFASPCSFGRYLKTRTSLVTIPSNQLSVNYTYSIIVAAKSADGRTSSQTISVTTLAPGVPIVTIPSKRSKFNADSVLQLNGLFVANYSLRATWNATFSGAAMSLAGAAMTPLVKIFSLQQATNPSTTFPLAIAANTFIAGRQYTFTLYAYNARNPGVFAYSQVVLNVNSPPTGGRIAVTPTTGYALQTSFFTSQSGWIDDLEDYPLTYDFLYQLTNKVVAGQPKIFTILTLSALSSVSSVLPAGLATESNQVRMYGRAEDIYLSASNVSMYVKVTTGGNNSDPSAYLKGALAKAMASGDTDAVYQSMNLAASSLSVVVCSAAPNCTALNREGCGGTINTCGSCLSGYTGIVGDSNKQCKSSTDKSGNGAAGDSCSKDTDCRYGSCKHNQCAVPDQTCPTSVASKVCSGHGQCNFTDTGGNSVTTCPETSVYCTASCACTDGYGGVSCSLTPSAIADRETSRVSMCNAVLATASKQTPSAKLVDLLVSTLYSAYDPHEVRSTAGIVNCSQVLITIGNLASQGYMKGTVSTTPTEYAELISMFTQSMSTVVSNTADDGSADSGGRRLSESSHGLTAQAVHQNARPTSSSSTSSKKLSNNLQSATTGLTKGTTSTMVAGQSPVSVVSTSGVKVTAQNSLTTDLSNAQLSPPQTTAEVAYAVPKPTITVPGNGMAACDSGGGYAKMSTAGFGTNPHPASTAVKSSLLQFTANTATPTGSNKKKLVPVPPKVAMVPAYYVTMHFNTPMKDFNFTASKLLKQGHKVKSNFSLPACSQYNGQAYVSCGHCNVSSYSRYNVTYGCYDITNLCPTFTTVTTTTKRSRRLDNGMAGAVYVNEGDIDGDDEALPIRFTDPQTEEFEESLVDMERNGLLDHHVFRSLISVATSANTNATDDGGAAATDDGVLSTKSQSSISQYGALLEAVVGELASTLSVNPFDIDLAQATPILALCGALAGSILFGVLYLSKWDAAERKVSLASRHEEAQLIKDVIMRRKELCEKGLDGGNGILTPQSQEQEDWRNASFFQRMTSTIGSSIKHASFLGSPGSSRRGSSIIGSPAGGGARKSSFFGSSPFKSTKKIAAGNAMEHEDPSASPVDASILKPVAMGDVIESTEYQEIDQRSAHDLAKHFADAVLPDESLVFAEHYNGDRHVDLFDSFSWRTMMILLENHYMTNFWINKASLSRSRALMYMDTCRNIMIWVFIYTLFFSLMYPDPSLCSAYQTKATCLALPGKILSDSKLCTWSSAAGCAVNPPPASLTFSLMVTLICYLIGIPIDIFIGHVQSELGAKDPDFGRYNLQKLHRFFNRFFGACFVDKKEYKVSQVSSLGVMLKPQEHNHSGRNFNRSDFHADRKHDPHSSLEELELGCVDAYSDLLTPHEELSNITNAAQLFFHRLFSNSFSVNDIMAKERVSTLKAIQQHLMMNPDGTFIPLSWRQRLFYKDRQDMLEKKIIKSKKGALDVIESVQYLPQKEASSRDVALIHFFMIENVHWFYRVSLRMNLLGFNCLPEGIDPVIWILSWVFISGCLGFFLYWTFVWGIKNGPGMLPSWGLYFGMNMIEDIFFTQIVKIMILKVLAIIGLRPQLRVIRRVIMEAGVTVLQHTEEMHDMRIVQHYSSACRAARSHELFHLPAAAVLRSLDDHELERCLENRFISAGGLSACLILIPAIISVISTAYVTNIMDCVIYSFLNVFLILTYVISLISVPVIIILSASLGGWTLYYYGVFVGSVRRASRLGIYVDALNRVHTKRVGASYGIGTGSRKRKSFWRQIGHSLFYFVVVMADSLSLLHVLFSLTERRRLRDIRQASNDNAWRAMNCMVSGMTYLTRFELQAEYKKLDQQEQQPVPRVTDDAELSELDRLTQAKLKDQREIQAAVAAFPVQIRAMQPTGEALRDHLMGDKKDRDLARAMFDVQTPAIDVAVSRYIPRSLGNHPSSEESGAVDGSASRPGVKLSDGRRALTRAPRHKAGTSGAYDDNGQDLEKLLSSDNPLPVLVVNGITDTYAQRFRNKTERTTDVKLILDRMLIRYVFGAVAYARSSTLFDMLDTLKPADIYLQCTDALLLIEWATETFFPGDCPLSHEEINEYSRRLERWWKTKEASFGVEKLRLNFALFSHWFTVNTQELIHDRVGFVTMRSGKELETIEQEIAISKRNALQERKADVRAMVQLSQQINLETDKIRKKPTPTLTPIGRTPTTTPPVYSASRTPPLGTSSGTPPYASLNEAAVLVALHQSQKSQKNMHEEEKEKNPDESRFVVSNTQAKQTTTLAGNQFLQSYLNQQIPDDDSEAEDSRNVRK